MHDSFCEEVEAEAGECEDASKGGRLSVEVAVGTWASPTVCSRVTPFFALVAAVVGLIVLVVVLVVVAPALVVVILTL